MSKSQLQEKAAEVFERNPKESKLFGTLDGNIFIESMEHAARHHAKVKKLDVIEFTHPDRVKEVKGSSETKPNTKSETKPKGEEKIGGKYDDLKRKQLDVELKERGLDPKDYNNIAACIAALEADDVARAEKAAADKAAAEKEAAEKEAAEKVANANQGNAGSDEGQGE